MTVSSCALLPKAPRWIALQRNPLPERVAPLRVADLEIDALHLRVRQGTRDVRLSPDEHILLYVLAARAGALVSYREIADALGRTDPELSNNALARHVSTLRGKLEDDPHRPRYIETVPGIGYRMRVASGILVVEDDPEVSRLLQSLLGDAGYRVTRAGNGELALKECVAEDPALILLDLQLPGMDGAEFFRAYRAHPPARAKVIVISGAMNAAEFARRIVADAFMAKPFDVEILLRTVRRLMPRLVDAA